MSYIQGTAVKLIADFTDRDTGEPTDPAEVVLTIEDGLGQLSQKTLSAGQVQDDTEVVGRFFYVLDTSPNPGTWTYQFESTGNEATLGKKDLTVRPRLGLPVP